MQKKYIVIIIVLVVYLLLMMALFASENKVIDDTYIIVGNDAFWHYKDEKWESQDIDSYNFSENKFKVYKDQLYQGDYFLQNYNDTWYFFNDNNESSDLYGELFAYLSEEEIKVLEFTKNDMNINEVNEVLKDYDIEINSLSELSYAKKIEINLDTDEEKEYIYSISNVMMTETGTMFSIVLYEDKNKIKEIIYDTSNDNDYIYSISNIIDINSDGKYEIIMKQQMPMNIAATCHSMYQLKKGKYELIKECD